MIVSLALKSLRNRKLTATLTVLSIALSVLLLLGVERVREQARESFAAAVSGTDLIVGARGNPVHLLLYAVFHIGNATNNIRWDSYQSLVTRPGVAWALPLAMGDSHRGFRVVGTSIEFFTRFRYGDAQTLKLSEGSPFSNDTQAVLGAEVARQLRYTLGSAIVLAHGAGEVSFIKHDEHPFTVTGILAPTGTPVDRAVYISLEGVHALHDEDPIADPLASLPPDPLRAGAGKANTSDHDGHAEEHASHEEHADAKRHAGHDSRADGGRHGESVGAAKPSVTAALLGLSSRAAALSLQRSINEYPAEPLTAILPGPTLLEVWGMVGMVEKTLFALSVLVLGVGLAGMLVALLTSLNERRREMSILRAIGARPAHIFALIMGEAGVLTAAGIGLGFGALYVMQSLGEPWLQARFGLFLPARWPTPDELALMALVAIAGILIGALPAYRSYRRSLADGLTPRV